MTDPVPVVAITAALIALSGFFVAVEFSLIAARRHRLEDSATTSRSARAALRSSAELPVLLAGAQLGITLCTLALGAITKPAVDEWLLPVLSQFGWPEWVADLLAFLLALLIVTFLHLVIGEMAPKSWAIAHPERSAIMLARPMRAFMWVTRPLLRALNKAANWCLHRVGVQPVDSVSAGQDPNTLKQLVEHSAETGALDAQYQSYLRSALDLESLTIADIVASAGNPVTVTANAKAGAIQAMSKQTGHLRVLVRTDQGIEGVVHVRDSLEHPDARAVDLLQPVLRLERKTPVYTALQQMRENRRHLALVTQDGIAVGIVTLTDLLNKLMPTARRHAAS